MSSWNGRLYICEISGLVQLWRTVDVMLDMLRDSSSEYMALRSRSLLGSLLAVAVAVAVAATGATGAVYLSTVTCA